MSLSPNKNLIQTVPEPLRLLLAAIFLFAGATWLLQKPAGSIVPVEERARVNKPAVKSQWVNQTLSTSYKNIYLYSAYLVSNMECQLTMNIQDDREGRLVRVLGLAPHRMKVPMVCIGEDKHGARVELKADLMQNNEHFNLPYSSYFFNCALRDTFLPVQVTSFAMQWYIFIITARLQLWRSEAPSMGQWRG